MRGRIPWLAFVLVALILVVAGAVSAQTRGLTIKLKASEAKDAPVTEEVRLYGSSHALVIGIDNYTGGWPRLSNAVKDARLVAAELKKRGFAVTLKTDLKSAEMKSAFEEFFVVKGADPQARLFVWYAGHGHTADDEGFLVPADAPKPSTGPRFKLKALNMRRFGEYVRQAVSKHAFAVFDSCFAGTVFDSQRALPPEAITHATTMPVRQFLTSGDATQTVSDDGTFRELFLRALRGEERADANGDGYVTGTEMGLFLSDRVTNLTRTRQTPRYGKLRDKDYDLGDFVFALAEPPPRTSTPTSPPAPTSMTAEMMFWQSMKDSADPDSFQAYLDQFPNGTFAGLARLEFKKLKKAQVAIVRPAPAPVPAPSPAKPAVVIPKRVPSTTRPSVMTDPKKSTPDRPVTLVVPFAPGGASDMLARFFTSSFSKALGATVIVRNLPGAGGAIGANRVSQSEPNGYTLGLFSSSTVTLNPHLGNIPYSINSWQYVCNVASSQLLFVTGQYSPLNSVADFVKAVTAPRVVLAYGTVGSSTLATIAMASTLDMVGGKGKNVAFRTSSEMIDALNSGQIDVAVISSIFFKPSLKALAVYGNSRMRSSPAVPTMLEFGYNLRFLRWWGILAPKATPAYVVAKLTDACSVAVRATSFAKKVENTKVTPQYMSSDVFEGLARSQHESLGRNRAVKKVVK